MTVWNYECQYWLVRLMLYQLVGVNTFSELDKVIMALSVLLQLQLSEPGRDGGVGASLVYQLPDTLGADVVAGICVKAGGGNVATCTVSAQDGAPTDCRATHTQY